MTSGSETPSASRPRPLRVLMLTNMWPIEGRPAYGNFVASQVRSVAELDVSARIHFVNGFRSRRAFVRSALRILRMNFGPQPYDLIHAHGGYSGALALLQRRLPVLTSFVGYDLLGEPELDWQISRKSRIESAAFRQLSRCFARTITKSSEMERTLPASVRARNTVLPNGVDRSMFHPLPRAVARERLGWEAEGPVALFVGDPAWGRKRFDLASRAAELARQEHPALQLRICAHGPPAEVPLWMNAADLLIMTSNVEGSPNAVKEAMACDLPIVSVDAGDVREVVQGTRNCHITAQDPPAIAAAIGKVLEAWPDRSDGRRRSAWLDSQAIATRLIGIYRETAH